jgi:membrane protein required for colicin V production
LPDDPESTILKRFKKTKPDDDQTDAAPEIRSTASAASSDGGYGRGERDSLRKLIEGKAVAGR